MPASLSASSSAAILPVADEEEATDGGSEPTAEAARALGLDCGPMSGFDNAAVDSAFFPDGKVKSNFLCNLGYGDDSTLRLRSPRFDFDEMAEIV